MDETKLRAGWMSVDGRMVPCVNAFPPDDLRISQELLNLNLHHPYVVVWYWDGTDGLFKYHLWSEGRSDVGEVARRLGGGGSPTFACFFLLELLPVLSAPHWR